MRIRSTLLPTVALSLLLAASARSASHSDAPLIQQDPQANITDVYAFVSEGGLNVVTHVRPYSEPGDGPVYDRFADDAQYSIHITDPFSGEEAIRYDFRFTDVNPTSPPKLKNPNTILSYGLGTELGPIQALDDARRNYRQQYFVRVGTLAGSGMTPPPNVGLRTTPHYNDPTSGFAVSGASTPGELDVYTQDAIFPLPGGGVMFAGLREDGFYADIAGIFDLLDPRILDNDGDTSDGLGQDGAGVDGFKGFNVLAYAIQVPLENLEDVPGFPVVGVYASVSRRRIRLLTSDGPVEGGPFVQVNRMANPLFNEAFVPLQDKDRYNRTKPVDDAANFATYAADPELAALLSQVFGFTIPGTGRGDLVSIYIPDVLRVDTSTGPVPLPGQVGFNRLSGLGGDTTNGVPSGWPNGRRVGDDVVDIALTAVAGGVVPLLGDNVNNNDQLYHRVFPYSATPHAGAMNRKDP